MHLWTRHCPAQYTFSAYDVVYIGKATQVRQEAVAEQAQEADLLIVVGDPKSNNSQFTG